MSSVSLNSVVGSDAAADGSTPVVAFKSRRAEVSTYRIEGYAFDSSTREAAQISDDRIVTLRQNETALIFL